MADEPLRFIGTDGRPSYVAPGTRLPVDIGSATVNLNGDVVAEFDGVEEALGAPADAAAGSDSGTSGLIGLIKRLLGKLPSGFQQGGGAVTSTTTRVTLATDGPTVSTLTSIDNKTPALSSGRVPVDGSGVTQPVSAASLPLPSGAATAANQTTANTSLAAIAGLSIPAHDWIGLTYTGSNLTGVTYKTGGSGGTTVGTLTLAYSGSNLTSVTKS